MSAEVTLSRKYSEIKSGATLDPVCICSTNLVDLHGLDLACVSDVGTSAQVNQGPTSNRDS